MPRNIVEIAVLVVALAVLLVFAWMTYRQKGLKRLLMVSAFFILFIIFFLIISVVYSLSQVLGIVAFVILAAIFAVILFLYYRNEAVTELGQELKKRNIKT